MLKICHITSAHPRNDVRIFHKECASLSNNNYDVTLIVADGLGNDVINKVNIIDVGKPNSRFKRWITVCKEIYKKLLELKPEVIHFHDPELMYYCKKLKKKINAEIIYDIHEDFYSGIKQKKYIPIGIRQLTAFLFKYFENYYSRFFHKIIAEKYYEERFPNSVKVLNYPNLKQFNSSQSKAIQTGFGINLLYTGGITSDRGAYTHAKITNLQEDFNVYMVGACTDSLKSDLIKNSNKKNLFIDGEGFVSFETILSYYNSNNWLAGLAIFPKTKHYYKKELTKFFEYMYVGIPIIASNFSTWKKLIEGNDCGICINPESDEEIISAINFLKNNPDKAIEMGKNGKKAVADKYNWLIEEQKLLELYSEIHKNRKC